MVAAVLGASYCGVNECRASDLHAWFFGDAAKTMNVLTFVLVVIAVWQISQARASGRQQAQDTVESLRISQEAADAARKTADAGIEAQRSRFHIVLLEHNFHQFAPNAGLNAPDASPDFPIFAADVRYAFKNYGKTPGLVLEVSHGIVLSPEPPVARLHDHREHFLREVVVAEGDKTDIQVLIGEVLSLGEVRLLASGGAFLWFYAQIGYRDVFGVNHTDGFMYRFPGVSLRNDDPPYLYEFSST